MGWYDGLHVDEHSFCRMAAQFSAIQFPLFSKRLSLVAKEMDGLAYAEPDEDRIVVAQSLLNGTNKFFDGLPWDFRLELFDGIIVHEVGHFMYSPSDLKGFQIGTVFNSYIATIANLLEDLFIEDQICNGFPYFEPFLYSLNKVVINDSSIEEAKSETTGEKPTSVEEAERYVNYCISYKRREKDFVARTEFEAEVYEAIYSVFELTDVEERKELVYKVYEMIFENVLEEVESQSSSEAGEGEGEGEGQAFDASFSPGNAIPQKIVESMVEEIFGAVKSELDIVMAKQYDNTFTKVVRPGSGNKKFKVSNFDFSKLAVVENARGSVRIVKGAPMNRGKNMSHLHRALDDGKIFSKNYLDGYRAGHGAPEIVFLIDLSGSMESRMSGEAKSFGEKVEFALSSVLAFNKSLRGTKTKFAIVGHTTTREYTSAGSSHGLLIVEFKGFNEIVSDDEMLRRTEAVHREINYYGNADGAALLHVNTMFGNGQNDKIIFIVSDGRPAEDFTDQYQVKGLTLPEYGGIIENVKSIAAFIRSKGVKLFSASIDRAAVVPCDSIYGWQNNVMVSNVDDLVNMVIRSLN